MQYQSVPTYSQYLGSYQQPPPYVNPIYQQSSYPLSPYQNQLHNPFPHTQRIVYNNVNHQVQLPPPIQHSQKVFYPTNNVVSWHPLEAKIQNQNQFQQNQNPDPYYNQYRNQFQYERNNQNQHSTKAEQKIQSNKSSQISIKDNLDETPKFSTKILAQMISKSKNEGGMHITDKLVEDESIDYFKASNEYGNKAKKIQNDHDIFQSDEYDEDDDGRSDDYEDDESQSEGSLDYSQFQQQISPKNNRKGNQAYGQKLSGLRYDKITDENRFETLYKFEKINKQHQNLFGKDFKEDLKMKDIFGDNTIYIDNFNLSKSQGKIPSYIWQRTINNVNSNILKDDEDDVQSNEEIFDDKNMLWEARYQKIHEYDYMVSYANNIFNRKSNYLKLGLFYKQALIKYQFDRSKEIVYYMYSYDEYSIKKKQSEMATQQQGEDDKIEMKIDTLQDIEDDEEEENYDDMFYSNKSNTSQQKQNKDSLSVTSQQKSKIEDHHQQSKLTANSNQKSVVFNQQNKSRVLNNSQIASSNLKSKVLTTTTYNKQDVKSQIKDSYDFSKSNFLRDYEKTHFGESIAEEEEEQEGNRDLNRSQSQDKTNSNNTSQYSDNYSKLYKRTQAGQRSKVINSKKEDLSKIKNKKNKYRLWEKNAVSEDLFLDQVRDSTIDAVKRARNLEQAIVEKTSIFEHHAASLLNQHLSQLRKVSKEYKKKLYLKVREIIQCVYDEYRDIINFESNNTYVMLVCDKKDNDKILGLHYYGYQGKKYFEKYFDQFVTYGKTRKEFEEKRYQAFLLNKAEESYCRQHFLN